MATKQPLDTRVASVRYVTSTETGGRGRTPGSCRRRRPPPTGLDTANERYLEAVSVGLVCYALWETDELPQENVESLLLKLCDDRESTLELSRGACGPQPLLYRLKQTRGTSALITTTMTLFHIVYGTLAAVNGLDTGSGRRERAPAAACADAELDYTQVLPNVYFDYQRYITCARTIAIAIKNAVPRANMVQPFRAPAGRRLRREWEASLALARA
ncbi:hypothetical protein EVAR_55683_1 [Eumeta japonica]|uniref:Uncharacterized protein n=1 Tax=Eumeta variegata TaxID=151549 RepID=A0A4C1ZDU6_EUMVA|nr:hypothetical protein EVAR_55683_1 [Eumeta japonica]